MDPSVGIWFPIVFFVVASAIGAGIYKLASWDGTFERRWHTPRITSKARLLGLDVKGELECAGTAEGRPIRLLMNTDESLSFQIAVKHPPKLRVHRDGLVGMVERAVGAAVPSGDEKFDGKFVVTSRSDRGRASAALDDELRKHVKRLFEQHHATDIDTFGTSGGLYATKHLFGDSGILHVRTAPRAKLDKGILRDLVALADILEGVPLHVVKLGGERRAERSTTGAARCAYCHGDITGSEPDLVACEKCATILHEGCWAEQGGCPTLGCGSKTPERARASS